MFNNGSIFYIQTIFSSSSQHLSIPTITGTVPSISTEDSAVCVEASRQQNPWAEVEGSPSVDRRRVRSQKRKKRTHSNHKRPGLPGRQRRGNLCHICWARLPAVTHSEKMIAEFTKLLIAQWSELIFTLAWKHSQPNHRYKCLKKKRGPRNDPPHMVLDWQRSCRGWAVTAWQVDPFCEEAGSTLKSPKLLQKCQLNSCLDWLNNDYF